MSTEHQKYSTENQADAIREYAQKHDMEIVRTYTDAGKSGLRLEGRDGLKQLLEDVKSGSADFEVILVYDVSRWGRFQDADESGYYEVICRSRRDRSPLLRRAVRQRRHARRHHREGRQARHGGRVQP